LYLAYHHLAYQLSFVQIQNQRLLGQNLCHRDLKPENLFFDKDFVLKVADFGFAQSLAGKQGDGKLNTILGTDAYMAPELNMMQNSYKGIPIDLFSSAVILYIFMTGAPCFKSAKPEDPNYKLLCTNKHVLFWKQNMQRRQMKFSKEFIDLMNAMLAFDPLNRPTIPEI
jgi:serine/threonine protein kinase